MFILVTACSINLLVIYYLRFGDIRYIIYNYRLEDIHYYNLYLVSDRVAYSHIIARFGQDYAYLKSTL